MEEKEYAFTETKFPYEALPSYMAASVVTLIIDKMPTRFGDMADQVRRAALSVTSNIAEGFRRSQKSPKYGRNLFDSANGSSFEVASQILQSLRLFQGQMSAEEKRLLRLARYLLFQSADELQKLVEDPRRAFEPEKIGVFSHADVVILRGILEEVDAGKNVQFVLLSRTSESSKPAPKRYECYPCRKLFSRSYGRTLKVRVESRFWTSTQIRSYFFCYGCLEAGKPERIDKKGTIHRKPWKKNPIPPSVRTNSSPVSSRPLTVVESPEHSAAQT